MNFSNNELEKSKKSNENPENTEEEGNFHKEILENE